MADREQDALVCAARRREREAHPPDPALYVCRCDHDHPPGVSWCDLCQYPVEVGHGTDEAVAAERERIRALAVKVGAHTCSGPVLGVGERVEFADLIMHDPDEDDHGH